MPQLFKPRGGRFARLGRVMLLAAAVGSPFHRPISSISVSPSHPVAAAHQAAGMTLKEKVEMYATRYPSLVLGILPVIGGLITTPMQMGEIERDQKRIRDLSRVAIASILAANRTAFPREQAAAGAPLSRSLVVATGREAKKVVEEHMRRIELMRAAVRRPPLAARFARQAVLKRGRAVSLSDQGALRFNYMHGLEPRRDYMLARSGFRLGQPVEAARAAAERNRAMRGRGKA